VVVALAAVVLAGVAWLEAPDPHPTALSGTLVMTRTGGEGGWDDRLVVYPDGIWVKVTRRRGASPVAGRLATTELRAVEAALAGADLRHRHTPRRLRDACCDLFFYTFAYRGSDYATADGRMPASVRDLLDVLTPLLDAPNAGAGRTVPPDLRSLP